MALLQYEDNVLNKLNKKIRNAYDTYGETSIVYQKLAKISRLYLSKYNLAEMTDNGIRIKRREPVIKGKLTNQNFVNDLSNAMKEFSNVNVRSYRQDIINIIKDKRHETGDDVGAPITIEDLKRESKNVLNLDNEIYDALQYLYDERLYLKSAIESQKLKTTNAYAHYFDTLYGEASDILNKTYKSYAELRRVVNLVNESKQRKLNLIGEDINTVRGIFEHNKSISYMVNNMSYAKKEINRLKKQYNQPEYSNPLKMTLKYILQ